MTQKINKFYFRRGSKIIPYNASKSIFLESLIITKKKLYDPFLWMGFNCLKAIATSRRQFTGEFCVDDHDFGMII